MQGRTFECCSLPNVDVSIRASLMSQFFPFPVIKTKRLVLREIVPTDLAVMQRLQTDVRVVQFFGRDPLSPEQVRERVELIAREIALGTSIRWGIALETDSALVGTAGFWRWDKAHQLAEIGYELAPEQWGKGIMHEALQAIVRYGFECMQLHRVEANVDAKNVASRRVLEKVGFMQEGLFRENWLYKNTHSDTAFYGLLARDLGV